MKKYFAIKLFLVLILMSLSNIDCYSQNFLTNGGFESGGSGNGFLVTAPYSLATTPGTSNPGNYSFVINPTVLNATFINGGDHTSGLGRMMVVDGSVTPGLNFFWTAGSTGGAVPGFIVGQRYVFSYWIKSVSNLVTNAATQANINFFTAPGDIDPTSIVPSSLSFLAPLPVNGWQKVSYEFTATDTSILFRLYNTNLSSVGNDFAIDDMSVVCANPPSLIITDPSPVCSPSTVNLTLTGVASVIDPGGTFSYFTNAAATIPLSNPSSVGVAGTYYIKYSLSAGCETVRPVVVTIQTNTQTPPTVKAIAICQSKIPVALTATPTGSNTLIWYGTAATLGTPSLTAPIPSTAVVGVTNYYVSQTNGVCESTRAAIPVNVAVDTGVIFTPLLCRDDLILPADKYSSVYFDWNQPGGLSDVFDYSYTIQSGPPVTGKILSTGTKLQVFGMLPGQSAILTITSASHPCTTATWTCSVPCVLPKQKPDFAPITKKYCLGDNNMPTLSNFSPNGIQGTWSPAIVSSAKGDTYRFTPDPILHPCAETQDLYVTVVPVFTPTFGTLPNFVCENAIAPILPKSSTNTPPITGDWDSVIDTSIVGSKTYTFNPDAGQCVSSILASIVIPVITSATPTFSPIPAFCSGATTIPSLPPSSIEGIAGIWIPAFIDNTKSGTYTFKPTSTCSSSQTLNVTVDPNVTPTFAVSDTQCEGTSIIALPNNSTNTPPISGTWDINTIDTSIVAVNPRVFTAAVGSCVISPTTVKTITVYSNAMPTFGSIPNFCSGISPIPLLPLSNEGITGVWSPNSIDNTISKTYQFTPDKSVYPCAPVPPPFSVTVIPTVTPSFGFQTNICENSVQPNLPLASSNIPPITGTWIPSDTVDSSVIGTTSYTFLADPGQCSNTLPPVGIKVNPVSSLTTVSYTVTGAFTDNQIIEVTALATGDYLYQLDNGSFQSSNIFENVSSGAHSITVKDEAGCNLPITKNDIIVMNYPKFFTPNGDGFNDTWKISDLNDMIFKIYIFDRYGKLLKEISPDGLGWDGTYLGQQVPADDYWFTVDYVENLIPKKLRSHFSLKR